jgi:OHCU decarboxylase
MRALPTEYELVAPRTLPDVLSLLAHEPGAWLPIAGGTDVMVQYSAGKLTARKLVSIWNLPELRSLEVMADEIQIGAGCTYTDLRAHEVILRELSLLSSSASWTGGIANQNRGTIGGNIVNASPAADSLPALMVYGAELLLVSARGERRVPYASFHISYRKTQLAPDELIRAICLKRQFSGYYAHARKVGARNAQAISKVCLAALGLLTDGVVDDIRLAVGSVAPVPLRLSETEQIIKGKPIDSQLIQLAKRAAAAEVRPIDDIRSTSRYRAAVAANLVGEFLEQLSVHGARSENSQKVLARWNGLQPDKAAEEILPCCGSKAWAGGMTTRRPVLNEEALLAACDEVWRNLPESDWLEAFCSHPRIGDSHAPVSAPPQSAAWSSAEQQKVGAAGEDVKTALAAGNREYEQKFNRIFIVCATGKSVPQILEILQRRLLNGERTELHEAAEQQRQIAHLRLKKWLSS